ncbi:hypothetical protein [Thermoactinospora rubra]|uniref:hypothetical protein n=1 Tax=Thermoactinospora rubra TaxID=1088767 RepID=UPI0019824438|nr:hypothetical protein [Thermoactinospora rubra]
MKSQLFGRTLRPGWLRHPMAGAQRLAVAALALALALIGVGATASPGWAAPATPDFGPSIDGYAAYDGQDTCDPVAKPGVTGFRDLLNDEYGSHTAYITRACGEGGRSEHKEGRALDYMLSVYDAEDRAVADDVLNWLLATDKYGNKHANARRLGIMYIIWNRQQWKAYEASAGWQSYGGSNPHTDHIHFSFSWAGANKQTTWWTSTPLGGSPDDVSKDGVAVLTDARVALYTVRSDGNVWGRSQDTAGGAFNDWQQLSTEGGFQGRVAVLRDDYNRIALYVRRGGTVYGASQATTGGPFSAWKPMGTNGAGVVGDPLAVYGYAGRIAIYALNSRGNISGVSQLSRGGAFGEWQELTSGGGYAGKPTAVVDSMQRIAVYARRGGTVYGASQDRAGGPLGTWSPMGTDSPVITGDPAAIWSSGGRIALYVTNDGGDVYGTNQVEPGKSFRPWQRLTDTGGYLGKPTVLVDSGNRVAIYARRDGTVYGASQGEVGGPFENWNPRGTGSPLITGDPTAVFAVGGRIAIYAATTGDAIGGVNQETAGGSFGAWVIL